MQAQAHANGHSSLYANGYSKQQQQQQGTYSMWSGLPGIDLTPSYNPLGTSLWPGGIAGGAGSMQQDPVVNFQPVSTAAKAPPPGFGPVAYGAGAGAAGSLYKPSLTGSTDSTPRYNPLGAGGGMATGGAAARAPPPGMSAYRPQLGTGL